MLDSTASAGFSQTVRRLRVGVGTAALFGIAFVTVLIASMNATERILVLGLAPVVALSGASRPKTQVVLLAGAWAVMSCVGASALTDPGHVVQPLTIVAPLLAVAGLTLVGPSLRHLAP